MSAMHPVVLTGTTGNLDYKVEPVFEIVTGCTKPPGNRGAAENRR